MTIADLIAAVQALAPHALFDEGPDGEVIVYTGLAAPEDADWDRGDSPLHPL